MRIAAYTASAIASIVLLYASYRHWAEFDITEAFGFVTGAACVWLVVKENIWNWPVGIANSLFYIALFWKSRLFADMSLQVVYVILGFLGWYWWLHGGRNRDVLHVGRTPVKVAVILLVILIVSTVGMTAYLTGVKDSAPFWDAITTTLSLVAQFQQTKKMLENWHVWITADVIYIGLYCFKHLYLTAILYAIFIVMCVVGLRSWRQSMVARSAEHAELEPVHG